jgi:hypothetical protein
MIGSQQTIPKMMGEENPSNNVEGTIAKKGGFQIKPTK